MKFAPSGSLPIRGVWFALVSLIVAVVGASCVDATAAAPPVQMSGDALVVEGGVVVSAYPDASEVGAEVLRNGGNAVDAAIATGFALAVTHPTAGNIGGGGFMVIRFPDGSATTLDFREKAPLAAHPEMFLDENGEYSSRIHHRSHIAVGVPGTVAGFVRAHESYGRTDWADLVDPSVGLASNGFVLQEGLAESLARMVPVFANGYDASHAQYSKDGVPYEAGETLVLSDLGRTLARIRDQGRDGFYRGETADLLVAEMERGGGLITLEDLARYEAEEREPIKGTFRGYDVIGMGPPSSGGVAIVEMLNILEGFDLAAMGHNSPQYVHHLVESMRHAYRDRAAHLADPGFSDVPVERLTSKDYAATLRETIDPARASESDPSDLALPPESPETTHYSVVDADGMAVSVTYTLESGYGSFITVPGGGFLLNNEMGDFNARPGLTNAQGLIGTTPNLARPEQRMLSSMSPTILAKDGDLVAVIGSPGGRTIINTVLELALNVMEFGMAPEDVVAAKRFHHQWLPAAVRLEEGLMTEESAGVLMDMGHQVSVRGRQGAAHSIVANSEGQLVGVPDPRSGDAAAAGH